MGAGVSRWWRGALIGVLVLVATVPNMVNWFGYSSAMTESDMQAVEWLDRQNVNDPYPVRYGGCIVLEENWDTVVNWFVGLRNGSFTSTPEVAPWIYERFTSKEYVETVEEADFVIARDEPMTPRCDEDNVYYKERPEVSVDGLELLAEFGGVKIYRGER